jgi:hypothetical protein
MIIQKNSVNELTFKLAQYFDDAVLTDIIAIEITFGTKKYQVRKLWYLYDNLNSTATFNRTHLTLKVKLTAEESSKWQYQVPVQIRIKNKSNKITTSEIFYLYIQEGLSAEEF